MKPCFSLHMITIVHHTNYSISCLCSDGAAVVQHSSQELRDNGVHEILAEWEDALQEGNMATPSSGGQHQVMVLLGNTFRNGWREGGREGAREGSLAQYAITSSTRQ